MRSQTDNSRSMANQFRRNYLFVSIVPLLLVLFLVVTGIIISRNYLNDLIVDATNTLNRDAESSLQALGERIIKIKARDVAKQLEIYFRTHPGMAVEQMRADPLFMEMGIQKVGNTGYTAMYEAPSCIFRVHPNEKMLDKDMSYLKDELPSWWAIVGKTLSGNEVSGYYDWIEADGTIRKKYMTVTPVGYPLGGHTMMVAATSYIDEFSAPIKEMQLKADQIAMLYQRYVSQQGLIFGVITTAVLLLTFAGTYFWGRRAALQYILPIMQLADTAKKLGEGHLEETCRKEVLDRRDEIGTLAQAFQRMASQLMELFHRLEQRVQELDQTQKALQESEAHFKTLYEESKRSQELYRSLIHSSADAIIIYDMDGCATYLSPMFSTIFGWSAEELIGRRVPFVPESEKDQTMTIVKNIIETGTPYHGFETKRLTKEGQLIDVSISASRFYDHEGQPAGMLVILRDISEAKRLEAQLQHIERMEAIGTLAGGIAHDFNNLLMVIQGSAALVMREADASSESYKYLANIEKQVQRGSKLTNQLLGYARKGKYEVRAVDLNDAIMEHTETFRRTRKDITIHYNLAPDLNPVEADLFQIEQVLMNLYINASDAMPDGGALYLNTRNATTEDMANHAYALPAGRYVVFHIEDTGIGMDTKTQERIFDPFFTTKEMGRGTGLGLASVYGIVKGHGGNIDVTSTKGQGTAFTIVLPASKDAVRATPEKSKPVTRGKGTILLIDDEELVLDVCASMFKSLGYTVLTADSGESAIDLYRERQKEIDLIVLDMIMPDISGSVAFDHLREINPRAQVMLCSGYSIDGKAEEILNRGCVGFIQKPYTIEQLAARLDKIMKAA